MNPDIERVAEAIREHQLGYTPDEGFHCVSIVCDWTGHDLDFPEHQAEAAVVEALGLTEEWGQQVIGEGIAPVVRRLVSPWRVEEQQP